VAKRSDSAGTQTIEVRVVRKDKDKNYYAKSTAGRGIYKVATIGRGARQGYEFVRNKKLFDSDSRPDTVTIDKTTTKRAPRMDGPAVKQMDSPSIQAVIDKYVTWRRPSSR